MSFYLQNLIIFSYFLYTYVNIKDNTYQPSKHLRILFIIANLYAAIVCFIYLLGILCGTLSNPMMIATVIITSITWLFTLQKVLKNHLL